MQATSYFKIWVTFYQAIRHHIPEECNLYSHCRKNLKSHTLKYVHTSCKCLYILNETPFPCTIIAAAYLAPISERFYCDQYAASTWTPRLYQLFNVLHAAKSCLNSRDMTHKTTNSGWCDLSQICYDDLHWMAVHRGPVRYNTIRTALIFIGVLSWSVGPEGLSLFLLDVTAEMLRLVAQG
jgi:hypothetical protein